MTRIIAPFAAVCWFSFVVLVGGCKGRDEAIESSNEVEALPPDTGEGAAEIPRTGAAAEADPAVAVQQPVEADPAVAVQQPVEEAPVEAAGSARDLAAELRAAVGSPADCLQDYQSSSPTTIRINISGVVRPTGMIIEEEASGRGLSANEQRCVRQRVGDVMLAPLPGDASEPVSTYVDYQYQPPTIYIKEFDVGGPAPELKDVVEPLPKKAPIAPSGVPIDGPAADPIEGPKGVPIEGSQGVPIEGPKPEAIDGYQVDQDAERWTD